MAKGSEKRAGEQSGPSEPITVEESCACGATFSVSAFDVSTVNAEVERFHRTHDVCRVSPPRSRRVIKGSWDV